MNTLRQQGFTAVELLITIIVGMIFLGAMSQAYTVVINDAAATRYKATASTIAYAQARAVLASLGTTCAASNATISLSSTGLPGPVVNQTTNVACPYAVAPYTNTAPTNYSVVRPDVTRITITVSYGSAGESVKHVIYKY